MEGDFSAVSTEGAGATLPISVSTLLAACTLSPPRRVLNLASSGSSAAACRRARVRVRVRVGLRLRRNPNPNPNPHPDPNPDPTLLSSLAGGGEAALTLGVLVTATCGALFVPDIVTVWALLGSSVAVLVAFVLPTLCYLAIRAHKPWRGKKGAARTPDP